MAVWCILLDFFYIVVSFFLFCFVSIYIYTIYICINSFMNEKQMESVRFAGLVPDFRGWLLTTVSFYDNLVSSWTVPLPQLFNGGKKKKFFFKELDLLAKADAKSYWTNGEKKSYQEVKSCWKCSQYLWKSGGTYEFNFVCI